jgi:phosphoribosylamine--glycine ligase
MREIVEPTVRGMASDGVPFRGFLYAGLMIDSQGAPKVIEFNVRFGDPETQPIMLRLRSDLVDLVEAALERRLDRIEAQWDARASLAVVMAAAGYPGTPRSGDPIVGLDPADDSDVRVFHAGTRFDAGERVVTAGGRVLAVAALGRDVGEARARAYARVESIRWEGEFHRRDIGWRALAPR